VFACDEASRFVPQGDGDPQTDMVLAWELLYRLEPGLYDRLASVSGSGAVDTEMLRWANPALRPGLTRATSRS
jgi:hypothetical protein